MLPSRMRSCSSSPRRSARNPRRSGSRAAENNLWRKLPPLHPGEMDGKDSSLALLREMLITKSQAKLLDKAVVVFIPIYNIDGHERRSPYNRINQNGPEEMGWRTQANNLNLNRDYMKADTV